MSSRDRILGYLQSIAPADASNSEIVARTGIKPDQQVFMITRDLMQAGAIRGLQAGHEWRFWHGDASQPDRIGFITQSRSKPPARTDRTYPRDTANILDLRLVLTWSKIGRVILDGARLKFPTAQPIPGLYRFRIRGATGEAMYIGESENLARRFNLYSNPGPSQQTNMRLNANFRDALSRGSEIAVAIVVTGSAIELSGTEITADLSAKAVRRLFEHAAIVQYQGGAIESLNR